MKLCEKVLQATFADDSEEYKRFEEKFKPKKTTDDCFTPENIYEVIVEWATKRFSFDRSKIVRPFYPGGDYERENYPEGSVVLDNPPFSILSKICRFYNKHDIKYFLFAPALTLFNNSKNSNYIVCGAQITYANGAIVNTSFVTNMGEYLIETAPDLTDAVKREDEKNRREKIRELPKYEYPAAVIHAAKINYFAVHGINYRVKKEDALFIRKLDAQGDKTIFGGGFLLTDRAAAERAAAERAAAIAYELSPREREMQKLIGKEIAG